MVKSICLVVAISNVGKLLNNSCLSEYCRLIYIKNYLLDIGKLSQGFANTINTLLTSLQSASENQALNKDRILQFEKEIISLKHHENNTRWHLSANQIVTFNQRVASDILKERAHLISTPTTILHGNTDKLITYDHAIDYYEFVPEEINRLCITPFLTHGTPQFNLKALYDVKNIIGALAFFIENAYKDTSMFN